MDEILQKSFPTVLAPRFSRLEKLQASGERFILTKACLQFEVSRPWVHAVHRISGDFERSTPYGDGFPEMVTLRCGPMPKAMMQRFLVQARLAAPFETAAWIVWDENSKEFQYVELEISSASRDRVQFARPALPVGTHLVLDIHSHGEANAFFSGTDDQDDADQLCLSMVVGRVSQESPAQVARLSMLGAFVPMECVQWNI